MSMWCPKCQNITYNKKKCDKCNHIIEDNSKTYKIPKYKPPRTLKINKNKAGEKMLINDFEKDEIKINKNSMITIGIIIIAISAAYLAINKYRENRANEEVFKYMTGSNNPDEYINATPKEKRQMLNNSRMVKEMGMTLEETNRKQIEMFNNMLGKK